MPSSRSPGGVFGLLQRRGRNSIWGYRVGGSGLQRPNRRHEIGAALLHSAAAFSRSRRSRARPSLRRPRRQSKIPFVAVRVRRDFATEFRRFFDHRADFVKIELRDVPHVAVRQHSAGGQDFDVIGVQLHVLTHEFAKAVRTVGNRTPCVPEGSSSTQPGTSLESPWPPVIDSAWPAAKMRGPTIAPSLTASRMAKSIPAPPPTSRAFVVKPFLVASLGRYGRCRSSLRGRRRPNPVFRETSTSGTFDGTTNAATCVSQSIRPGIIVASPKSTTDAPLPASPSRSETIRSPATTSTPGSRIARPSKRRAALITVTVAARGTPRREERDARRGRAGQEGAPA